MQALQAWALRLASDQGGGQGEGTANSASGLPAAGERLAQDYPALWARHVARGQPVDDAALARDWHALARTDPAGGPRGFSLLFLDKQALGMPQTAYRSMTR